MLSIGEKISKYRESKHYTQKQLAEIIGSSQTSINLWESGKRKPKFEAIRKIADALEIPLSELLDSGFYFVFDNNNTECLYVESSKDDINSINHFSSDLLEPYNKLNSKGKEKAIEQVEMLTKIDEYTKNDKNN